MKALGCAVAISAAAFYFGLGLHPLWPLPWLAAIIVLGFAFQASTRQAFAAAFFSYLLGSLNLWNYFRVLEVPIPVRCLALVIPALVFAAAVYLSKSLLQRRRRIPAVLALPVTWTIFEFAFSLGRNGTALNLSYSQMNCLPLLQLASITGLWGISFFVFFFASSVAMLWTDRRLSRDILIPLVATILPIFFYGEWRLNATPAGREVRIGLAASDQRPLLGHESEAAAITDSYVSAIGQLASQGANVIVLPEKIYTTSDFRAGDFYKRVRQTSIDNAVRFGSVSHQYLSDSNVVVAGVDQRGSPLKHNLAFALSPLHEVVYEKHHMVVGWEDGYEVGRTTVMLPWPYSEFGVAICKDMDFPRLSRQYSQIGAQLMLVPAWDFEVDDWLHSRMAIMRSVESGFAMARSAKQGFMTINDNRGRVLFEAHSDATGKALLLGTIRISAEQTFYSRFGNWFIWLNLVAYALSPFLYHSSRGNSHPTM